MVKFVQNETQSEDASEEQKDDRDLPLEEQSKKVVENLPMLAEAIANSKESFVSIPL